ncbi:MAG: hypothetical protein ACT4N8_09160, partial [Sphingosinicella sp.]|uniref:hypothetical protein n=1 Tax=Sphingosinicella sp. TaxID=1917971 RepID=UPI004037C5E7
PAMIGQDAFDKSAEAFASLVLARRRVVETHQSLDLARAQIGLQEVSSGDTVPKPNPFTEARTNEVTPIAHIRAVA